MKEFYRNFDFKNKCSNRFEHNNKKKYAGDPEKGFLTKLTLKSFRLTSPIRQCGSQNSYHYKGHQIQKIYERCHSFNNKVSRS